MKKITYIGRTILKDYILGPWEPRETKEVSNRLAKEILLDRADFIEGEPRKLVAKKVKHKGAEENGR